MHVCSRPTSSYYAAPMARVSWMKLYAWPMRQRSQIKHHKRPSPEHARQIADALGRMMAE